MLGAAAVIALVDGDDVLGLAAANGLTALGWGIAAAVLLINTLLPRLRHERDDRGASKTGHDRMTDAGRPTSQRTPRTDADRDTTTTSAARRSVAAEPAPLRDGWVRVNGEQPTRR